MSSSIARSVRKIKEDLGSIVAADQIARLCDVAGHVWRDRTLCPVPWAASSPRARISWMVWAMATSA